VGPDTDGKLSWRTFLLLGRVSNLPTVWSNALAGLVLAGGGMMLGDLVWLLLLMSLFYVGGMYLNDAFDHRIDAVERPERPIPSGQIDVAYVFSLGFGMLAIGVVGLSWLALMQPTGGGWRAGLAGLALAAAIVYYDWRHKNDPLGPAWMGVCRMLVYLAAGLVIVATPPAWLYGAAFVLFCYLIGLTYIAKQENLGRVANLWPLLFLAVPVVAVILLAATNVQAAILAGCFLVWLIFALHFLWRRRPSDIPRAVVSLIAGMSLLDAVFIAHLGVGHLAWAAAGCFVLTLALQRFVPGT
jgi:4-hydroxybenzoate polyprenyltransferase